MIDQEEIRINLMLKKEDENLSWSDIEKASGVSRSTLSRFARKGSLLDFDNLTGLADYLGIENLAENFVVCDGNTLENVKNTIKRDRDLTREKKILLWRLFYAMYRVAESA